MARLKDLYIDKIRKTLMEKFNYKNIMQVPKLDKVVLNVTSGEVKESAKVIDSIMID